MTEKKKTTKKEESPKKKAPKTDAQPRAFKFPATIGGCADRVLLLKEKVAAITAPAKPINEEIAALEEHLLANMSASDAEGVTGKIAVARVSTRDVPTPDSEDPDAWVKIHAHIKKTGDYGILHRKLSTTHVSELMAKGENVPGVKIYIHKSVLVGRRK